MEKGNPTQINAAITSLTTEEQTLLQKVVQEAKERMEEQEQIPELHLNGN
jgi:hypothetical protein